jgi:c-di-AMP phosphodiesterase-like protein
VSKLLKNLRRAAWILLALGFSGAIAILLCYLLIAKSDLNNEIYIVSALSLAASLSLISLIVTYVYTAKIEKTRHLADMKATDIVGNDIGVAYDFGQIGLIVTDDKGNILWLNNLLLDRGINLVDYSINELSPKLYELMMNSSENEGVCSFRYSNKYYDAKFIKEANLFVLKDTTDFESLVAYNAAHAAVIGYLNIDNYSDITVNDEMQRTQIEASIREAIIEYFRKYNTLLKPLKMDSYMLILTREDLKRMEEDDKFSIIMSFSKEFESQGLTCSLGFGYGYRDFTQNNELASSSLDLAMSRGGNQCVVAPSGENMKFYGGGNTESSGTMSKVKIKTYARSFLMALERASNVLIVPHSNADMDAMGAALGVYAICHGLRRKSTLKANIVYNNQNVERGTDAALRSVLPASYFTDVFVSFAAADDLKSKDTLIVAVDHSRPMISIYPDLYKGGDATNIAVIDHHRKVDDSFKHTIFEHIDSASSSTCELLALYLGVMPFKVNMPSEIATLMLSGIYLDTQNFKTKTRILTHEAAIILTRMEGQEDEARDFLKEDYESFVIKSKILANVDTYSYGVLIAKADEGEFVNPALLASVCNELTGIEGVQAAFGIGHTNSNDVYISARGNGKVNCEMLMLKMNGGGHFSAAATQVKNSTVEQVDKELRHILDQYLKDASNLTDDEEKGE